MVRQELENLRDLRDLIVDSITEVARLLESHNQALFEEWKSGGKIVNDEIPGINLSDVIERLEDIVDGTEQHIDEEQDDELLGRFLQR